MNGFELVAAFAIAEAVFPRIDVLGARDFTYTLTVHNKAGLGSGVRNRHRPLQ